MNAFSDSNRILTRWLFCQQHADDFAAEGNVAQAALWQKEADREQRKYESAIHWEGLR